MPDGSSISIDVDALAGEGDSGVLSEDATDLLVAAGEAARDRKTGIVIAIDASASSTSPRSDRWSATTPAPF